MNELDVDMVIALNNMDVDRSAFKAVCDQLDYYAQCREKLATFEVEYGGVIQELRLLERELDSAEVELKAAARDYGDYFDNAQFQVLVTKKVSCSINGDRLVELCPWLREVPGAVKITTTVNEVVVKGLVKAGSIDQGTVDSVTEAKALTSAISIRQRGAADVARWAKPDPRDGRG